MTPTPRVAAQPAYVVILRCGGGGLNYTSLRMTRTQAEVKAATIKAEAERLQPGIYLTFESNHGMVFIMKERLTAIEALCTLILLPPPDKKTTPTVVREVETR